MLPWKLCYPFDPIESVYQLSDWLANPASRVYAVGIFSPHERLAMTAMIEWNGSLAVGIAEIDEQHRKLITLIQHLQSVDRHPERESSLVEQALDEMVAYTMYHFGTEERLMEEYAYPQDAGHLAQHERFLADVTGMMETFMSGSRVSASEIGQYLGDWLIQHIQHTDRQLAIWLAERAPYLLGNAHGTDQLE